MRLPSKVINKIRKIISICLIICLCNVMILFEYAKVASGAESRYQYIYDREGNEITVIQVKELDGTIYLYGRHARSSATISYRTFGYNIALIDSNENPKSLGDGNYAYLERLEDDGGGNNPYKPNADYVVDSYRMDGHQVRAAMIQLMTNQRNLDGSKKYKNVSEINAALASGVTVYLSNVFKVIQRSGGSGSEADGYTAVGSLCHSYNEIIQEVRNVFGVDWSDKTQDILHYYYDNPVTIRLNPFTYDVVYIEQEDFEAGDISNVLKVAADDVETICGSKSEFTIDDPQNIDINGTKYEYAGESYYIYEDSERYIDTTYSSGVISVDHLFQKNATMYVLVKSKGDNEVVIRYVDKDGTVIKDNINGGKLTLGEMYTYTPNSPISNAGKVYKYTNEYSYSYQLKSTGAKKEVSKSGNPVTFKLSDVKKNTKVTLTLVYEKADGVPSESSSENIKYLDPNASGMIKADSKGAESFSVTEGIPTTETLYGVVQGAEYLIEVKLKKLEGTALIPIIVKKTYTLEWTEASEGEEGEASGEEPEPKTETVEIEEEVFVERNYSYSEIVGISYYKIKKATLQNGALPGELLDLYPSNYSVPTLTYEHFESSDDITSNQHIEKPAQMDSGIILDPEIIEGTDSKPEIPTEDFKALIESEVDLLKVRNDALKFDGAAVLDSEYQDETAEPANTSLIKEPKKISDTVMYRSYNQIPASKSNGVYQSSGSLIYESVLSFGDGSTSELSFPLNVNNIVVHTPVVCDAKIWTNIADNQMINPDKSVASLVLDRTFKVSLPTVGSHRNITGYGYRDYGKYTSLRQVLFPFDVYRGSSNTGTFIPKNTWTSIAEDTEFYLPTWVTEGKYTIQFRSVAINASGYVTYESLANLNMQNYVAVDSTTAEVSGRIYGLNIYDMTARGWEDVFRVPNSSRKLTGFKYTVGVKNQNGESNDQDAKYTIALVNGSHPLYQNMGVLKTGYVVRFNLQTVGTMNGEDDYIRIKPTFWYVDKNGQNRQEVDIYYKETFNGESHELVKMGSDIDKENKKTMHTGSIYTAIDEKELKQTAFYRGFSLINWMAQKRKVYTFTNIMIPESLRTFVGYQVNVPTGVTEQQIAESVQNWYGEYYLPAKIHVVKKDFDVWGYTVDHGYIDYTEDFWLDDGYIIINFEIETIKNGERHLSYTNATNAPEGYCNMWIREGYQNHKTDYKDNKFTFKYGDFILYYTNKSVNDDYIAAGTH